jgi:uncharacterized protein (TIGR03067 family)
MPMSQSTVVKLLASSVLVVMAGLVPGGDAQGAAPDDAFQGAWRMSSFVVDGDAADDDQIRSGRLVVEGDRYVPRFGSEAVGARFTLDPKTSPKSIDFTYLDGPQKGKTVLGIYSFEGESLTICRALTETERRPTKFAATPGSGTLLVVWKRGYLASEAEQREVQRLQGTWVMVSATSDGQTVSEERSRRFALVVQGTMHKLMTDGKVAVRGVGFEVDPSATPKQYTNIVPDGSGGRAVVLGIYKLEGDTLTTCQAAPGRERPRSFDAGPGTGRSLHVFQRVGDAKNPSADECMEHLRFEGTWTLDSLLVDGKPRESKEQSALKLTLRGDRFLSVDGNGTVHGTFRVATSSALKTIDITFTDGPQAGRTLLGIYSLDGDAYRVCFSPAGEPRPLRFEPSGKYPTVVSVMKRLRQ